MIRIASLQDLDRAVATAAFCHEPPLMACDGPEVTHASGAWKWRQPKPDTFGDDRGEWLPIPFSTCPTASFALENRMRELGWEWFMLGLHVQWRIRLQRVNGTGAIVTKHHAFRFVAMELAACAALGLELELVEGWDKR